MNSNTLHDEQLRSVKIINIPPQMDKHVIVDFLEKAGSIVYAKLGDTDVAITFENVDQKENCLKFAGFWITDKYQLQIESLLKKDQENKKPTLGLEEQLRSVKVTNIPSHIDKHTIIDFLKKAGSIVHTHHDDKELGVTFENVAQKENSHKLQGFWIADKYQLEIQSFLKKEQEKKKPVVEEQDGFEIIENKEADPDLSFDEIDEPEIIEVKEEALKKLKDVEPFMIGEEKVKDIPQSDGIFSKKFFLIFTAGYSLLLFVKSVFKAEGGEE